MTFEEFQGTVEAGRVPTDLNNPLMALWHDARGDWERAHQLVQDSEGHDAARVHAYLHRKEGDESNARYWYSKAQQPPVGSNLEEEWTALVIEFLDRKTTNRI